MRTRTVVTFVLGPVVTAALGALTLPLTTWIFQPEDIGRLNVAQTLIALVVNGVFLGLDNAYVREFHEQHDAHALYATTMTPPFVLLLILSVPVVVFPSETSHLLYGVSVPGLAWATVVAAHLSLLIRQWSLVARMREQAVKFSIAQLLPKLTQILGILLVLASAMVPDFALLFATFIGSLAAGAIFIGIATARNRPLSGMVLVDLHFLRKLLRYSLPAMVAASAYVALTTIGVFALRFLADFRELGVYSIAMSIGGVVGIVQYAFNTVWSPLIFRAQAESRAAAVITIAYDSTALIFGLAAAAVGLLSWAIPLFLPGTYAPVAHLVIGTSLVPLVLMMRDVGGIGINITRRMGFTATSALFALFFCIGGTILLVPWIGATGAVMAQVVSMWMLFVVNTEISARIWFAAPRRALHLTVGGGALLSMISLWCGLEGLSVHIWLWAAYAFTIVVHYRRTLAGLLRKRVAARL